MPDGNPPESTRADVVPVALDGVKRWTWRRFTLWGKRVLAVLAGIPTLVVGSWIIVSVVVMAFRHNNLELDALGVPESLSKAGFTSEVATQRLRDGIFAVQDLSQTTMARKAVDTDEDWSAVTVSKTGFSLEGAASTLRGLLSVWQNRITGEFTESGKQLSLQLRLNGRKIFEKSSSTADPDSAAALIGSGFEGGAFRIVKETQPYVAASALYGDGRNGDAAAAENAAEDIIARFPSQDESVMRALNLKGIIAYDRGDYPAAKAYFERASALAVAHFNLGNLYRNNQYEQHDLTRAVNEYNLAIQLDPKLPWPHQALGDIDSFERSPDAAIGQYQIAARLAPASAWPHVGLGVIHRDRNEPDRAVEEFEIAISLDPTNVVAFYDKGLALEELASSTGGHSSQSQVLQQACETFVDGSKLPHNDRQDYAARIQEVDLKLNGKGHCPPE
jgi:tetratricopeptide (TPR) repeat protein